ncbi:MAG: excinuclease ABC subunit A [Rickettsiales bacterium]|nr:excinuclease ABC subunit A [Rickettsiales bacterium]
MKKVSKKNSIDCIKIIGARQHNLKNINLQIPKNQFVVITGLSGSGKSSLAFDTIYAEGQRRYVESLSSYARQFLNMMEKPDVDLIEGLSPSISIDQKTTSKNPRSTVGTVTEIYDYFRVLFARIGKPYSPETGKEIKSMSVQEIIDDFFKLEKKSFYYLLSPVVRNRKGEFKKELSDLVKKGYIRFRINGDIYTSENLPTLKKNFKHNIEVVVDRIQVQEKYKSRISQSIETALNLSDGIIYFYDVENSINHIFSSRFSCPVSGFTIEEIEPRLFSFNSPNGACAECDGLGFKEKFDPELIIGNENLSMIEGVISPWNKNNQFYKDLILEVSKHCSVNPKKKWKEISKDKKKLIMFGDSKNLSFFNSYNGWSYNEEYLGVIGFLEKKLRRSDVWQREELAKYMNKFQCEACSGTRLKKEALAVKINKKHIFEITKLSIDKVLMWFEELEDSLSDYQKIISSRIIKEIIDRLSFLNNVGLGYLQLSRNSTTLSGGESQRIRLASQIGSGLTGVLYVLDEPSIGLHQRDNKKLIKTLKKLRDLGNSVIVVEHDEETIRASDYIIDIGLEAGINGGNVIAEGNLNQIIKNKKSITAKYLSCELDVKVSKKRNLTLNNFIQIKGAQGNNLKNLNVKFPLNNFISVTGVSGGGKSSLIIETLYKALSKKLNNSNLKPLQFESIAGDELIDKIIEIDQSPIGRTPRSNPATYTGCFTFIRDWYANLPESKMRGYKPGRFSFNVKGGRCENCQGDGMIRIEMHFLADVFVKCDLCKGDRFNRETLEIKFKNKSISDVLKMTVDEGLIFFKAIPSISSKLKTLKDVGLGYIQIGQSATTLSGGEAQRIKLAKELSKRSTGKTIYILDEPTTGLHTHDVRKLLEILHSFVDKKNTVVVIEHNLDVINSSDWIIDLGPEGGDKGGYILFEGTVESLLKEEKNDTAHCLKTFLKK